MKRLCRILFGYLLFDDRKGTPIPGLPERDPWYLRAWWGDEDFPTWWLVLMSWVRRAWYHGKTGPCSCPGCTDTRPEYWACGMCWCCATEDCCHDDPEEPHG